MSSFSCPVVKVLLVENHPNADRLSIVKLDGLGYICISGKLEDGSHRYNPGDWVVYIPSAAILPTWLLRKMDFWNYETEQGMLAGPDGNRVKPLKLRGIFSEGVLFPTVESTLPDTCILDIDGMPMCKFGEDASDILGITKYVPPIPVHMAGEVANMFGHTVKYDFERFESVTDIFDVGEHVVASEKLHGTCTSIRFIPKLNHPEMFGSSGDILVHSKGLGSQGLAFKNRPENANNLYVRQLQLLLDTGFEDKLRALSNLNNGCSITVMGETFGPSVQDLNYGLKTPEFRVFDIALGNAWVDPISMSGYADTLGLLPAPILYNGAFDISSIEAVRDGTTMINGSHIREGVVVRAMNTIYHPIHGRRIAKFISPNYLLRKVKSGEPSEFT